MILAFSTEYSLPAQFVVKRNQSLSWRANKLFIFFIALLTLGIAGIFALQGMWLILPFAGLEVMALTIGLYICSLHCRDREVITINDEKVSIESGRGKPKQSCQFERAWLNVVLKKPVIQGYPSQLLLCSKGMEIEIGKYLTNKERKSLAETLVAVLEKPLVNS